MQIVSVSKGLKTTKFPAAGKGEVKF